MHFRCVFTLLQTCVLLGLDWVEPMMLFNLHVTYSCIFHAYVPSFLYIHILNFFGALLLVYLSLLLSACITAPKLKSTPSWNLLRSRASSFDPTPSHLWFHDEKACKDFSENFSWWGIHSDRQVILSNFSNTDLPTVIYSRGWESLCGVPITCPSVIIQEVYSNMHKFNYSVPHFSTHVWGTRIVVTPDILSKVLHVLSVVYPD